MRKWKGKCDKTKKKVLLKTTNNEIFTRTYFNKNYTYILRKTRYWQGGNSTMRRWKAKCDLDYRSQRTNTNMLMKTIYRKKHKTIKIFWDIIYLDNLRWVRAGGVMTWLYNYINNTPTKNKTNSWEIISQGNLWRWSLREVLRWLLCGGREVTGGGRPLCHPIPMGISLASSSSSLLLFSWWRWSKT